MPRAVWYWRGLRFGFAFQHFTATVKAIGADVVTQVGFARCRLNSRTRCSQSGVRIVHAALRRRFFCFAGQPCEAPRRLNGLIHGDATSTGQQRTKPTIIADLGRISVFAKPHRRQNRKRVGFSACIRVGIVFRSGRVLTLTASVHRHQRQGHQ